MLERALKDVHFSVDPKRPAKAQALEVGRRMDGGWPWLPGGLDGWAAGSGESDAWMMRSSGVFTAQSRACFAARLAPSGHRAQAQPASNAAQLRPAAPPAAQALPLLKSRFPIERARMRLKLLVPLGCKDELLELVRAQGGAVEEQDLIGGLNDVLRLVEVGWEDAGAWGWVGGGWGGRCGAGWVDRMAAPCVCGGGRWRRSRA